MPSVFLHWTEKPNFNIFIQTFCAWSRTMDSVVRVGHYGQFLFFCKNTKADHSVGQCCQSATASSCDQVLGFEPTISRFLTRALRLSCEVKWRQNSKFDAISRFSIIFLLPSDWMILQKIFFIDLVIYILLTKSLMSFDCFQRLLLWSMFYCTWMILKVKA